MLALVSLCHIIINHGDCTLNMGLLWLTILRVAVCSVGVDRAQSYSHPDPNNTSPNDEKQWAMSAIDVNKRILT